MVDTGILRLIGPPFRARVASLLELTQCVHRRGRLFAARFTTRLVPDPSATGRATTRSLVAVRNAPSKSGLGPRSSRDRSLTPKASAAIRVLPRAPIAPMVPDQPTLPPGRPWETPPSAALAFSRPAPLK